MSKNLVNLNIDGTNYSLRPCGTCSTSASVAAKVVSIEGFTLCKEATVLVKFTQTNTVTNPTLNVSGTGAKPIMMEGQQIPPVLLKNTYYEFLYDGSNWQLLTNTSILHKHYSILNIGEAEVAAMSKNWYTIGYAVDTNPCIYQISSYAHTDVVFSVTRAYEDAALTIFNNSSATINADYACITGVRLVKGTSDILVQVRINYPKTNNSTYVNIDVTAIPTRMTGNYILNDELVIDTTEYEPSQIIKSFGLNYVGSMYASNFIGALKGNADTATNADTAANADTATSSSNLAGGVKGSIPYQTATGQTSYLTCGSNVANKILKMNSDGTVPSWQTEYSYTHPTDGANTGSFGPSADATLAANETFTIPYITVNNKGHVTKIANKTMTLPADDIYNKVSQTAKTDDVEYPVLLGKNAGTSGVAYETYYDSGITINPSTNTLTVTNLIGTVTSSSNLAGGNTGSIPYQTAAGKTSYLACGSNVGNKILKMNSEGTAPYWETEYSYTHPTDGANTGSFGPAANATLTHSGTFTIPYITVNSKGHVTKIANKTMTLPADNNTDTKVKQTAKTDNVEYPVLLGKNAGTSGTAYESYYGSGITINPSTNTLTVTNIIGTATSSSNLAGGSKGSIPYQTAAGETSYLTCGSNVANKILKMNSNGLEPYWETEYSYTHPTDGANTGSFGPAANATLTHSGTFTIPYITVNNKGHVTAIANKTMTLPADNNTDTKVKQTAKDDNVEYPILLGKNAGTSGTAYESYYDSGITINPYTNIVKGAKTYESLLQWGNTNIAGSLSPLDVAMDGQWSANRLSFMPASGINIEYSTDGGTTWTDYGLTDNQKRSFVTTGLAYSLYPGKNTTRQKTNSDKVRVTITAESGKTYFSLKKIYMYISQNGASGCKVLIEKAQCGSDTTFTQVGEYELKGWSGWNSIPLIANFGGGDGQTANVRRLRFTFYFTTYGTGYGETDDTSAVKWLISKLNMIGETSWTNSGGSLAATGHIYSYDIDKNTTFPATVNATEFKAATISATEFKENNVSLANKYNQKTSVISVTADTISSLEPNSMYVISNRTVTANNITAPAVNSVTTYSIFVVSGIIKFGSNISIYWANGSKPPTSTTGNYEVVITGVRTSSSIIYSATWAEYTEA